MSREDDWRAHILGAFNSGASHLQQMFSTNTSSARQGNRDSHQVPSRPPAAQPSIGTSDATAGVSTGVRSFAEMARIRGGRIQNETERQVMRELETPDDLMPRTPGHNYENALK